MAIKYSLNINSPFLSNSQTNSQTSSTPFNLQFGANYSDGWTKANERFNNQISEDLKSQYSFLDENSLKDLNPTKPNSNPLDSSNVKEKKKFNFGKFVKSGLNTINKYGGKGAEVFGKFTTLASPFLKQGELPNNDNARLSSNVGETIANWAPTLGPWGWAFKGVHDIAKATGGLGSGSDTDNKVADYTNGFFGAVLPGAGWFLPKSPEFLGNKYKNSAMYGNVGEFGEKNGGGKYFFNRGNINRGIETANIQTQVLDQDIMKPAQNDFLSAQDSIHARRTENELHPTDLRVAAKHGAVLQFTKRTLSKQKIQKHQIGGKTEVNTLPKWLLYDEDKNEYVSDLYSSSPKESIKELYQYTKDNLPGWKVWKSPNGQQRYFILPKDEANRRDMQALKEIEAQGLKGASGRKTPEIGESIGIDNKELTYVGTQVSANGGVYNFEDSSGNTYYFPEYKAGGKVNVIPDGALHKNKHHLTEIAEDGEKFEDVTTKGIPVVVEDEKGNLIQQAEVEKEEIIFRLEVTKKLEKLSKEHTDKAAIEAGKLLVKEILYNTEDNTGEML